jgi:nicotinamide phosphoribosyltransferase
LKLYPSGILSVVSDTWDLWNVLTNILPQLKDEIMARDGKLVIRPDSGNPADIICGTVDDTPAGRGVIELLWEVFGGTVNDKGYKVLDSHIGAIYGDSINYDRAKEITERLQDKGFASTNIVLGVGSFTYQYVTRDTFGFAMKATWAQINGDPHNLFKDPITDDGTKKSATGRLSVQKNAAGEYALIDKATPEQEANSSLQTVWKNGFFTKAWTFAEVRDTLKASEGAR